jgi:hypothetical protein
MELITRLRASRPQQKWSKSWTHCRVLYIILTLLNLYFEEINDFFMYLFRYKKFQKFFFNRY